MFIETLSAHRDAFQDMASTTVLPTEVPPSWWQCAPGEIVTLGWILLLHVAAFSCLLWLHLPSWQVLVTAVSMLFLGGLGTTVAYHRAIAHRSVVLARPIEHALVLFAVMNGSGNPATWASMHRLHHATADGPDDFSSPRQGGFWWAHLRWLWQVDTRRGARYARDFERPLYRFWAQAQAPLLAFSFFGGLLWPTSGVDLLSSWAWLGPLRLLVALHVQCTVNSICHLGEPKSVGGSSRNVWWLAIAHMGQGENWHANHHASPGNPRLGHRWQIDIGWWTIVVLRALGLARIRRPAREAAIDVA